jgi:hypothetical protein
MADVLTITLSGTPTAINLVTHRVTLDQVTVFSKGGVPELHFSRLLGTLKPTSGAALPDPWDQQPVSLSMLSSLTVFSGDIVGYVDRYMVNVGWIREYRCLGLVHRADYVPVTDALTDTDMSTWNLPGDDPNFIGARAGLSVGAIVADILNMPTVATQLSSYGIGNYTSAGPPPSGLPTVTAADLAALTIVPQWAVIVSGERVLQQLDQLVQSCYPSTFLHVDPSGNIRFFTTYNFSANTLTLNSDPILPPTLTRDATSNFSQVEIRGNTLVQAMTLQSQPWPGSTDTDGGLIEEFAWGSHSSAAAKALWIPSDWSQPNMYGASYDLGSCTCPSTTTVTVTSSNAAMTWSVNALSQANLQGNIILYANSSAIPGVNQLWQARVISNTALTAGGSSTLTLDIALPALTYSSYQLFALNAGPNVVGRKYKVSNSNIASAMLNYFPWPFAYVNSQGSAASLTSTPIGSVMWGAFGSSSPPFNMGMDTLTLDPVNGYVYFNTPVQVVANGLNLPVQWPVNVQAFLPIAVGTLTAFAPSSTTYSGTLYSVNGVERTKIISVPSWRDYGNQANMDAYASEQLAALQDVVVEGALPYLDLPASKYFSPGQAISITGSTYTTGWESLALPIVALEIQFQSGPEGTSYLCAMHLSNRRGQYSFSNYLRPNIAGAQFGAESSFSYSAFAETAYQGPSQASTGTISGAVAPQLTQAANDSNQLTIAGPSANQLTIAGGQE